jgi:hypothetical protein
MRLDSTEDRIIDKLDDVSSSFMGAIAKMLPTGVTNRPSDRRMEYKHLYWRTQDPNSLPMWLSFPELDWKKQILPYLEADAVISQPGLGVRHVYRLAMVELRSCVAIVATRFYENGSPHPEMAGVYILEIPLVEGDQLFGCLRHLNMGSRQCLSACILSRIPLEKADLEKSWLKNNEGSGRVIMNFPAGQEQLVPA